MKLSFIVPCCNEREGIPRLLDALRDARRLLVPTNTCEWVFIDDGSADGTAEVLRAACASEPDAQILRHEVNQGLGAALRTGFNAARGDVVVTMDSDCTYDPRTLMPMLARLEEGADVVLASPYHPQGRVESVPGYRLFLSRNLSRIYNRLIGAHLYTYTSLFRVYRQQVVRAITFQSDGFVAMAEIVVEALRLGYRVVEYPATLTVRRTGRSKAVTVRLICQHVAYLRRLQPFWRRKSAAVSVSLKEPVKHVLH